MDNTFDYQAAIQSIMRAGKAFERFASVLGDEILETFKLFQNLFMLSDEARERLIKKERHRRAYFRMMERRKK